MPANAPIVVTCLQQLRLLSKLMPTRLKIVTRTNVKRGRVLSDFFWEIGQKCVFNWTMHAIPEYYGCDMLETISLLLENYPDRMIMVGFKTEFWNGGYCCQRNCEYNWMYVNVDF